MCRCSVTARLIIDPSGPLASVSLSASRLVWGRGGHDLLSGWRGFHVVGSDVSLGAVMMRRDPDGAWCSDESLRE